MVVEWQPGSPGGSALSPVALNTHMHGQTTEKRLKVSINVKVGVGLSINEQPARKVVLAIT